MHITSALLQHAANLLGVDYVSVLPPSYSVRAPTLLSGYRAFSMPQRNNRCLATLIESLSRVLMVYLKVTAVLVAAFTGHTTEKLRIEHTSSSESLSAPYRNWTISFPVSYDSLTCAGACYQHKQPLPIADKSYPARKLGCCAVAGMTARDMQYALQAG